MSLDNKKYNEVLEAAHKEALILKDVEKYMQENLQKEGIESIRTIIRNISQNKYVFSVLVTCLIEKIVNPKQDIRICQSNMTGGFSNRSLDDKIITPFLKSHGMTACAASGLESGRNLERPFVYNLQFKANLRGSGNLSAFLTVLDLIETKKRNPLLYIIALFRMDMDAVNTTEFEYPSLSRVPINVIVGAVVGHFERAKGQYRSKLPVLAIYAVYQELIHDIERYKGMTLEGLEFHTTSDLRSKKIGDIQVSRANNEPFEGIEVKSDKPIGVRELSALNNKFSGRSVDRYYILSTLKEYVNPEERDAIEDKLTEVSKATGCEVIINGLIRSLWYYLRLVSNTDKFLDNYTELIKADEQLHEDQKKIWSDILQDLEKQKFLDVSDSI